MNTFSLLFAIRRHFHSKFVLKSSPIVKLYSRRFLLWSDLRSHQVLTKFMLSMVKFPLVYQIRMFPEDANRRRESLSGEDRKSISSIVNSQTFRKVKNVFLQEQSSRVIKDKWWEDKLKEASRRKSSDGPFLNPIAFLGASFGCAFPSIALYLMLDAFVISCLSSQEDIDPKSEDTAFWDPIGKVLIDKASQGENIFLVGSCLRSLNNLSDVLNQVLSGSSGNTCSYDTDVSSDEERRHLWDKVTKFVKKFVAFSNSLPKR